jgi:hypothetical protein
VECVEGAGGSSFFCGTLFPRDRQKSAKEEVDVDDSGDNSKVSRPPKNERHPGFN